MAADIAAPLAPLTNLNNSDDFDGNPSVSPAGTAVVWERCDGSFTNCGVMKSIAMVDSYARLADHGTQAASQFWR